MDDKFYKFFLLEWMGEIKKRRGSIVTEFSKGKSVKEIFGFDEDFMQKFYLTAYKILESGRNSEAVNAFTFLVTINPYNEEYWLGLGIGAQKCNDFDMAINAYEMAAVVNIQSPLPYFYLGKAFYGINDLTNSLKAFEMCLELLNDKSELDEIRHEAEKAKNQLIQRLKES